MNNLTEFEQTTANQIAIESGDVKNLADAKRIVKKCNEARVKLGLKLF